MIVTGAGGIMALLAAFLVTIVLGDVLSRHPVVIFPLILTVELTQWGPNAILVLLASSFHVYLGDIVAIGVIIGFFLRYLRPAEHGARRPIGIVLIFITLFMIGITRGLISFSPNQVLNFSRQSLSLWTTILFLSTVPVTRKVMEGLRNWLTVFGIGLTIFAIHFWLTVGFGTYINEVQGRALDKTQALVVLAASLMLFAYPIGTSWVKRFVPASIGATVVLLSIQKTVWLAGVVAIVVFVAASGTGQAARTRRRVVLGAGALLALIITFAPGGVSHDLSHSVDSTQGTSSSVSWRTQGWTQMFDQQASGPLVSFLIGSPVGTVFDRSIFLIDSNNHVVQTSIDTRAHSDYVQQLAEIGIIGLLLFILFLAWLIRGSWRIARGPDADDAQAAGVLMALVAGCAAFYVGYTNADISGIAIGLCASLVGAYSGGKLPRTPSAVADEPLDAAADDDAHRTIGSP